MAKKKKIKRGVQKNKIFHHILMNKILLVIGTIIIMYGLWFNDLRWALFGIIPMLIGYIHIKKWQRKKY
jgi:hypothetical protein